MTGILRATNVLLAGKVLVVVGYGWCGRGLASRARGHGGRVVVMEGYQVLPVTEAARVGELFVTVTGNRDALTTEPLPPGVHPVPAAVDERVARHKLAALGVRCDDLTAAQEATCRAGASAPDQPAVQAAADGPGQRSPRAAGERAGAGLPPRAAPAACVDACRDPEVRQR